MSQHQALRDSARALGLRVAVAGACLAALVSLIQHAPLAIAAARGGVTLLTGLVALRLGLFALGKAIELDRSAELERAKGGHREAERP